MSTDLAASDEWDPQAAWGPIERGEHIDGAAIYAAQRQRCPVSLAETADGKRIWHAFRADDVSAILGDPETFSSAVPKFGAPLIPIEMDPPLHGKYRAALSKMMSPRRLSAYQDAIRGWVRPAVAALAQAGGGDLAPFIYRLPMQTFCLLLGEEDESFDALDKARRAGSPSPQQTGVDASRQREALMAPLREFCRARFLDRRAQPRDDLASDIATALIDGQPIGEEEAVSMLTLIYIAGHGTTTSGMQSAVLCLARDPGAQQALRDNPGKIPAAIEESLRLQTPLHTLPRYCVRQAIVQDRTIEAGDQVYPVYAAANLDPDAFPDPGRFDIDRKPAHFAFGKGIHQCAGAPLARIQMRVLIEELLAASTSFALAEPVTHAAWPHTRAPKLLLDITAD